MIPGNRPVDQYNEDVWEHILDEVWEDYSDEVEGVMECVSDEIAEGWKKREDPKKPAMRINEKRRRGEI